MLKKLILAGVIVLPVAACDTWDTTNIDRDLRKAPVEAVRAEQVELTSAPFDAAHQQKLADLKVTVNKTTAFHPAPTVAMVETKLREDASKLGATKVVDVRISEPQISALSWGTRTGSGVAVKPN
ncbi:hypothetical protein [Antarcticimicrobium sediminis]|uniref:Heavy-metal-binding n=1 Tax=Antarcticimicrobium sediminis TaxID=2546227 RepID=A0A4R5EQ29_9RHOB|nr:hypothetical protein [Antarcticimicrobium sediminis]TDE36643.1 hypothetical protein E1B25_14095 [Antarcticimicrobium sediminis]